MHIDPSTCPLSNPKTTSTNNKKIIEIEIRKNRTSMPCSKETRVEILDVHRHTKSTYRTQQWMAEETIVEILCTEKRRQTVALRVERRKRAKFSNCSKK